MVDSTSERSGGSLVFSAEREKQFQELLTHYPTKQAVVIPALYLAQEEFGYVSVGAMEYVADRLELAPSKVLSTATFYTMFNRQPVGENEISVCTGPICALVGSDAIVRKLEKRLEVKEGHTTADRKFTLRRCECQGSCGTAPMLDHNGQFFEKLTDESLDALVDEWLGVENSDSENEA